MGAETPQFLLRGDRGELISSGGVACPMLGHIFDTDISDFAGNGLRPRAKLWLRIFGPVVDEGTVWHGEGSIRVVVKPAVSVSTALTLGTGGCA